MDYFKFFHKAEVQDCKGSVALALKHYLMQEIGTKMDNQGRVRMIHDLKNHIDKMKRVYERCKKKEYEKLGDHLD